MNREKYINDTSYREGYDDGRKEGANSVVTSIMDFLNILSIQIEYMKKTLTDTTNGEEGSKE